MRNQIPHYGICSAVEVQSDSAHGGVCWPRPAKYEGVRSAMRDGRAKGMTRNNNRDVPGAPPDHQDHQEGVQSVETGLRVLLALAEPGAPKMLKTIAEAAAMP